MPHLFLSTTTAAIRSIRDHGRPCRSNLALHRGENTSRQRRRCLRLELGGCRLGVVDADQAITRVPLGHDVRHLGANDGVDTADLVAWLSPASHEHQCLAIDTDRHRAAADIPSGTLRATSHAISMRIGPADTPSLATSSTTSIGHQDTS